MSPRGRSQNSRTSPCESPISRPLNQRQTTTTRTAPIVPRGQDRPRISLERSRSRSENCSRHDILADCESGPEETSPTFSRACNNFNRSPSILPCRTPSSTPPSSRSTPVNTPLFTVNARGSCCDHEKQFDALQRKLAVLTEKIDNLQGSSTTAVKQRRSENLPRDMVACVHKVVAKLKEKDPPTEWTFEQDHSFNDDTNLEVTQAIERGVQATSAFKEADPILLERAIKTYYKTLKAKHKRVLTRVRREELPQVGNKQDESVITARRNQRCHNKLKSRLGALRQSVYSEEKKKETGGSTFN
ncbi:PREDICTED: uncharacterized protein LOC107339221 isoform X2 [Acropora digitifera]|uniref:uncharacterized protein LOC107339221 isoform X2 n=1 Tax=Acropora digitifera TaxID=70779 RepID=UPI00077A6363|nr:PREDICTED: uncharacterized protein LOC107339221 isoform X2 [Acropora digitifera]